MTISLAAATKDISMEKIEIMRQVFRTGFSRYKKEQRMALEVFLGRKRCFYFALDRL